MTSLYLRTRAIVETRELLRALTEAVLGRAYRSAGNKSVRLSPPVDWVPSPEPDIVYVYSGQRAFRADFESSSYRRSNYTTSWTINSGTHEKDGVDGYITADLADIGYGHAWWYARGAVRGAGDMLERTARNTKSVFWRCFLPPLPART